MYIPRRRKARLKMGLMIAISSLSIGALAASTMAWYSVNTSITVNSSTVSIRTALQYHFYAFKGNGFNVEGNDPEAWRSGSGYNQSVLANFSLTDEVDGVPTDYKEVDELVQYNNRKDDYITALTKVSGLWPGYKMSFAVRIDGLQTTDHPSLTLKATNVLKGIAHNGAEKLPGSYTGADRVIGSPTTGFITMADAIKITAGSGDSLQHAVEAADNSTITSGTNYRNYTVSNKIATIGSSWYSTDHIFGTADPSENNVSWWYFFTVEFSDDNTTYYQYDNGGYYVKNTNGNSSCYEGLPFALGTMDLK